MSKTTISEKEFLSVFNDEDKAVKFFEVNRWPNGRHCPRCNSKVPRVRTVRGPRPGRQA